MAKYVSEASMDDEVIAMVNDKNNPLRGNADWLVKAVAMLQKGLADKVVKDNIVAYKVKNIIRIDIKEDI